MSKSAGLQDADDSLRDQHGLEVMRALRKGQAAIFNLSQEIRGEARIVERAFSLGAGALAEALAVLVGGKGRQSIRIG